MRIATHLLTKLQGQLGSDRLRRHAERSRNDLGQVLADPSCRLGRTYLKVGENAGDVASIAFKTITRVRRMEVSNPPRLEVVEPHSRQHVVN